MNSNTEDRIVGMSRAALDVLPKAELQRIAAELWGHVPRLTKPKLVLAIWEHAQRL